MSIGVSLRRLTAAAVLVGVLASCAHRDAADTAPVDDAPIGSIQPDQAVEPFQATSAADYYAQLDEIVASQGTKAAVAWLAAEVTRAEVARTSCHNLFRHVGQRAATDVGLSEAAGIALDTCEYGFLHGLMYATATGFTDASEYIEQMSEYCTAAARSDADRINCFHGTGHGVAVVSQGDLDAGTRACTTLDAGAATGAPSAYQCIGGLFMEYGEDRLGELGWDWGHSADNAELVLRVSDAQRARLCESVPAAQAPACYFRAWMFHVPAFSEIRAFSEYEAAKRVCTPVADVLAARACREGFGEVAFAFVLDESIGSWPPDDQETADELATRMVARCRLHPVLDDCFNGMLPAALSALITTEWTPVPDVCAVAIEVERPACAAAMERVRSVATGG